MLYFHNSQQKRFVIVLFLNFTCVKSAFFIRSSNHLFGKNFTTFAHAPSTIETKWKRNYRRAVIGLIGKKLDWPIQGISAIRKYDESCCTLKTLAGRYAIFGYSKFGGEENEINTFAYGKWQSLLLWISAHDTTTMLAQLSAEHLLFLLDFIRFFRLLLRF